MAAPLAQRYLELDIRSSNDGGQEITPELIRLSAGCKTDEATKLFSLISQAGELSSVMDGKGSVPFACSPVKQKVTVQEPIEVEGVEEPSSVNQESGNSDVEDVSLLARHTRSARERR